MQAKTCNPIVNDLSHASTAMGLTSAIPTDPHMGSMWTFSMEPSIFRMLLARVGRYSDR